MMLPQVTAKKNRGIAAAALWETVET